MNARNRNRFVKVTRERFNHSPSRVFLFYKPVELRNGNLYALCNEDEPAANGDHMGIYGFDLEDDAWRVIDRIEARERAAEAEAYADRMPAGRGDREDFHSDG